jgi:hypothetical protein
VGSTYDPAVLQGLSWDQIAGKLSDPASEVAKSIAGSANFMSAIICKLTNGQPASVCNTPGVQAGEAVLAQAKATPSASSNSSPGSSTTTTKG